MDTASTLSALGTGIKAGGALYGGRAAQASGVVLTAPYMDASKGRLVVTFATADKSGGGTKAVIASDVFLDDVVATVKAIKPTPNGFAFLLSKDGKVVAHPDASLALKDASAVSEQLTAAALKDALDPKAGWVEAKVGDNKFLISGTPVPDTDWQLFVAARKDEALASLSALLRTAVITALIMMAIAALAMTGTITAMLRGVDQVRAALDDISAGDGDLTQRLPAGGRDEVGRIAASFNVFAEKIQRIPLRSYFPAYKGPPGDPESAKQFLLQMFKVRESVCVEQF